MRENQPNNQSPAQFMEATKDPCRSANSGAYTHHIGEQVVVIGDELSMPVFGGEAHDLADQHDQKQQGANNYVDATDDAGSR